MTSNVNRWDGARKTCPLCQTSLVGPEIPPANRPLYGGAANYSRVVGVEVRGVYDGTLYWKCPDCHGAWHRFPADHPRHARAVEFVNRVNEQVSA